MSEQHWENKRGMFNKILFFFKEADPALLRRWWCINYKRADLERHEVGYLTARVGTCT